jgi:hypothetical protein
MLARITMRLLLVVALLLFGAEAALADGSPPTPDATQLHTDEDQQFVVALKGVTGAKFEGRVDIAPGQRRCFQAADSEGGYVLVTVKLHTGPPGNFLVEVKLVDYLRTGRAVSSTFSEALATGESRIGGKGWNNLVEIQLTQKLPAR